MRITRDARVRMERAHVHAWPGLRTASINGWLWRSSGGGSQRANSVSTIDFDAGADPDAAVAEVERRYHAVGAPARFQTFDETCPSTLARLLRGRGYRQSEPTMTMFKPISSAGTVTNIETHDHAWPAWRDVYLDEITENRRAINSLILDRIPAPRMFFGCARDGRLATTALCVISSNCAVIECVTTRADARRQGAAQAVLAALEHWAVQQDVDWIGLQVVTTNTPAIRLYEGIGFAPGATNRFWVLPPESRAIS